MTYCHACGAPQHDAPPTRSAAVDAARARREVATGAFRRRVMREGFTVADLAREFGANERTVYGWMRGEHLPGATAGARLGAWLNTHYPEGAA